MPKIFAKFASDKQKFAKTFQNPFVIARISRYVCVIFGQLPLIKQINIINKTYNRGNERHNLFL